VNSAFDRAWNWESSRGAPAAKWIIVLTSVVFILQLLLARSRTAGTILGFLVLHGDGLRAGMVWQPVTYMLLHGGVGHILMNMIGLAFLGPEVERRLGTPHFVTLYVVSGILGGLGFVLLDPRAMCVGASGAVFGVMAAFAALFPQRRMALVLFPFFTLPAWKMVAAIVLIEVLYLVQGGTSGGIAHSAHLAGALAGVVYARVAGRGGMTAAFAPGIRRRIGEWISPAAERPVDAAEMDRLLDKVASQGLGALTASERRRLEQASRERRGA
jgi:membrane associated rhomboid family serine protease